jgi:glycosyltransferase involved in cell wall biosynthesis
LFADPIFDSRSTVNNGIARLYEEELSVPEFAVIRNSPPFADLVPGPVDPHHIKLIHHGMASWDRGLREIVDAMRLLDARFSMTFMLLGSEEVISELKEYSADLADRIDIVPPAPMRELSSAVNRFDLEIMFYRPATRNLELALPNKLFEAVQGRLGLVAGRSPMMVDVINQHSNGVIVDGWEASDLAATLNALTAERVSELKSASHAAAAELSSEAERAVFLRTMGLDGAANRRASK